MDLELRDKVAVVTGGTWGIGLATARLLLQEGAFVAICGRNEARLAAAQSSLLGNENPTRLMAVRCDVLNQDEGGAFASAVERWSGRCDTLINNAGQARMSTFSDTTDDAWREELELKFFGQIYPIRAFRPFLDKSDAASILAVNSLLAYQPEPYMVATAAARAGAQNLLKSLAREFAPRIRVSGNADSQRAKIVPSRAMIGIRRSRAPDKYQWAGLANPRKSPARSRSYPPPQPLSSQGPSLNFLGALPVISDPWLASRYFFRKRSRRTTSAPASGLAGCSAITACLAAEGMGGDA